MLYLAKLWSSKKGAHAFTWEGFIMHSQQASSVCILPLFAHAMPCIRKMRMQDHDCVQAACIAPTHA